jgi:hypothetical protein
MRKSLLWLQIALVIELLWGTLLIVGLPEETFGRESYAYLIELSLALFLYGIALLAGAIMRRVRLSVAAAVLAVPVVHLLGFVVGAEVRSEATAYVIWSLPIPLLIFAGWLELRRRADGGG